MKEKFILCDCGSEALLLSQWDDEIVLSIYTSGQFSHKPNLMNRLRYCWYHLKTGKKYEDQVVLTTDSAMELSYWLRCAAQNGIDNNV